MKSLLLPILVAIFTCSSLVAQIQLVENGQSLSRIVIDTEDSMAQTATNIFNRFVEEMTGTSLPVIDFKTADFPQANDIWLGNDQISNQSHLAQKSTLIKEDGFYLWEKDHCLRIISGSPKGLVYAIITLLDDYLGMEYYAKETYTLSQSASLSLPPLDRLDNPAFVHRQTFSYGLEDPIYKWWFRLEQPNEVFAGNLWVHTFDRLLPSAIFGESHPEYYSYINGQRRPGKASQWCLTNEEVLERVTRQLDSIFKVHPEKNIISVSQNDGNFTYCTCSSCAAIDEREGSPSGTLIHFVNQLAERFPDKTISTLAYLYSMQPPKYLKPLPNVNIMLCSIDAMREVPLTDNASGQDFTRALEGWNAISNNIFVWDYGINFDNFVSPFPNFHILQPNMQLFAENNVTMHFAQVGGKRGEDFSELRAYMIGRLLWNPYQNADSLMQEFMAGYYGPAAPYLYQYQKMLEAALLSNDQPLWIYDSPVSHKDGMLRTRLIHRYQDLFDAAEKSVASNPDFLERVQRSRLPLQYAVLEIARTQTERNPAVLLPLLDTFQERTARFDVPMLNERNNQPDAYCELYKKRYLFPPSGNKAQGATVKWIQGPHPRYEKAGQTALTDELYGGTTFAESWIGWEGSNGQMILDLGQPLDIQEIASDFLHQLGAWILLPRQVTYQTSLDGMNYKPFGSVTLSEDRDREVKFVPVGVSKAEPVKAQFIEITIEGVKTCPSWHYGVGYNCWFFLDEIVVR
jgi:hypothetical protein